MKKINYRFKRSLFTVLVSAVLGLGLFLTLTLAGEAYSDRIMKNITSEVFRFHILADSDTEEAQALKIALRDEILEKYEPFLTSSRSKAETAAFFEERIDEIEKLSEEFLAKKGSPGSVKAEVTKSYFPVRRYGEAALPAGTYDCLKITIGKGQGHNWWCVMFPPLCYTSGTYEEIKEKGLSDETAEIITAESPSASAEIKIKFKIFELFNK
ncbi:MAG: stage II sporulation protein R [Eubacterium sp.]|nr:stage II sporulation protein R [Eubacterium sp.]